MKLKVINEDWIDEWISNIRQSSNLSDYEIGALNALISLKLKLRPYPIKTQQELAKGHLNNSL